MLRLRKQNQQKVKYFSLKIILSSSTGIKVFIRILKEKFNALFEYVCITRKQWGLYLKTKRKKILSTILKLNLSHKIKCNAIQKSKLI